MPHVAIAMLPGRDEETRRGLAQKTRALLQEELGINPKSMERFPEEVLYVKPGI